MELPSLRELELESHLRERDTRLAELTDEVTRLRQYLSTQPGPSTADLVTLPPALISILLPHFNSAAASATSSHSTVTAALTQRSRLLQEENDEFYELLKRGETGRLKEEVRGLRKVVEKLEGALRESHQVINSLSTELDKSYDTLMNSSRQVNSVNNSKSHARSPRNAYNSLPQVGNGNGAGKLPPTGPRAYKKPRLSEPQASPPSRPNNTLPSHKSQIHSNASTRSGDRRDYLSRPNNEQLKSSRSKIDVDEDDRESPALPTERVRDHDRERIRERSRKDRERTRDRERDRDGNRTTASRRNGSHTSSSVRGGPVGGGGGSSRTINDRSTVASTNLIHGGDRTLAERMGL